MIKDSNPKDSVGIKKVPASVVPRNVLACLNIAMFEGARKYGRHNYRAIGVRASVYFDAMNRHMDSWWEGEDIDPDSGLSHIDKAMACLVILKDSMMQENWTDDRPPKSKPFMEEANKHTEDIINRYPDPVDAYTEVKDVRI